MTEPRVFCETCQRWLAHDQQFCPLFPLAYGPPRKLRTPIMTPMGLGTHIEKPIKKSTKCICLVHTCYLAPKRDKETAPEYRDFV